MPIPEHAVRAIRDLPSLLQFLERELEWKLPPNPTAEEVTFEWSASELRLNEAAQRKLKHGSVLQLRPMTNDQPWGIFIVNFTDGQVYKTALRQVLRGLVPKRRRDSNLPAWKHENILFICTTANQEFTFAHFKGEKPERAKLVRFSWSPDEPIRTLCEFNLDALRMPQDTSRWTEEWQKAFDVEKVTEKFFEQYRNLFDQLQKLLYKSSKDQRWAHDYALQFLNRLMFLYFIQKKRWLGNNPRFVKSLWDVYKEHGTKKDTFFTEWLSVLFFEAFNERYQNRAEYQKRFPEAIRSAFAQAPYLNGGLFAENALDTTYTVSIPDSFFTQLFDSFEGDTPGFFERYNFTITEDTPLDQEVAVDPEMIGKVYESLVNITFEGITEEDLRGKAGIFYTPRIEIDLMCRLSLTDWLVNQLGEEHKNIIRRAVFAYSLDEKREADEALLKENLWDKLSDGLRRVTVLDPACGSGSFLIGMLLVIDDLQARANELLGIQETHYERRKRIIGQSLYGVDVMEWAVHVAELRLWLQLVIETELAPAELKFRPLLPNLSFKVRRGDSLVQEVGGISFGLHGEHLAISPALKGKLTALKGEKLKFFQGEYKQTERKRAEIQQDEFRIFSEILKEKKIVLEKKIAKLTHKIENPEGEQIELLATSRATSLVALQRLEEQKAELTQELTHIQDALNALRESKTVPFVWDIAFVEIFESDKQGFDIVIGNPPYVRQEMIADPTLDPADFGSENSERWKKKKAEYKAKLQRSVYEAYPKFFGYKRTKGTVARKIDGKCDLYIFFYLHGLSLLNSQGSFCFITSNSWLDVGYGADLQEFLLKHCQIKYIIDNEAKRSFAQADVNTVICLFSAPVGRADCSTYNARFVMFRVPFEQALSPIVFEEIDEVQERKRFPEFRVVAKSQEQLFEEGLETSDDEEIHITVGREGIPSSKATYAGDKWGGKYLRAPDIFYTILEKGKDKLVRLGDIAEVRRGFTTGANEFFYLDDEKIAKWGIEKEFLKPVIKSLKESERIVPQNTDEKLLFCHLDEHQLRGKKIWKYIKWGESQGFHLRPTCKSRVRWWDLSDRQFADGFYSIMNGDRHLVIRNETKIFCSDNLGELHIKIQSKDAFISFLNSTLFKLFIEMTGRAMTGSITVIKVQIFELTKLEVLNLGAYEIKKLETVFETLKQRNIRSIFQECGFDGKLPIRSQQPNPLPDRKALDDVVFDALGLTEAERKEVYWAVCELVQNRLRKAKSV
jgi:type I restriction-modification system DNA methylase subunit